jgi:hypothetical protein
MSASLPVLGSLITHSGESANRSGRGVTVRPKAAALTIDVWGGPKPSSTIHSLPRKLNCGPGRPKPCAGFSWDGSSSTRPTVSNPSTLIGNVRTCGWGASDELVNGVTRTSTCQPGDVPGAGMASPTHTSRHAGSSILRRQLPYQIRCSGSGSRRSATGTAGANATCSGRSRSDGRPRRCGERIGVPGAGDRPKGESNIQVSAY